MHYLLLTVASALSCSQVVVNKYYNKGKNNPFSAVLFIALAVALVFAIGARFCFDFKPFTIGVGIGFGLCYIAGFLFQILALKEGSVSLTSLVLSYSLVLPTLFGMIAYKEYPSVFYYIGLVALVVSLLLVGLPRRKTGVTAENGENGERKGLKITPKWAVYVSLGFLGNGCCSILSTFHQRKMKSLYLLGEVAKADYKSELMLVGMAVVVAVTSIVIFATRKQNDGPCLKRAAAFGSACGGINGLMNTISLIVVTAAVIPVSLIYPLRGAMDILFSFLAGLIFFKEKPDKLGVVGLLCGLSAIVLFNLKI